MYYAFLRSAHFTESILHESPIDTWLSKSQGAFWICTRWPIDTFSQSRSQFQTQAPNTFSPVKKIINRFARKVMRESESDRIHGKHSSQQKIFSTAICIRKHIGIRSTSRRFFFGLITLYLIGTLVDDTNTIRNFS